MKMKLTSVVMLLALSCSVFSQNTIDKKDRDSYLLFELGVVYPELEFINSEGFENIRTDQVNISSNRLAIGGGGRLVNRLGYLATLSSNRYDIRTYHLNNSLNGIHYSFDYAALDANLTFRFFKRSSKWSPMLKVGASYNYLVSGFQEFSGQTVNLKENEDFTNQHIDLNFGGFFRRKLTEHSRFWLGYNYKSGFMEDEKVTEQRYNINAHSLTLGFSISTDAFKKKDDAYKRILKKCNDNIEDLRAELLLLLEQDADTAADEFKAFVTPDENENSPLRDEIKAYVNTIYPNNAEEYKTVILFPVNQIEYYDVFQNDLNELIAHLKSNPAKKINVVGYADLRGKDDENLILSKNRAKTIITFLIDNGVDPYTIVHEYRGATSKFDDVVLMSNRRVEVYINY
jgi:outer membrane protein OmpA-like peptidoglycan-associated protein